MVSYKLTPRAQDDLSEIWFRIAEDSVDLADRIEAEFHTLLASLGQMPGQGHKREDLTKRPLLFFPLYSFLVVYEPAVRPIRIVAVVRGRRDVKRILKERNPGSEA